MRIRVATDGPKPALHAVNYAFKLLPSFSSTSNSITLISMHDDVGLRHANAFVGIEAVADCLRELSEKELKSVRKLLASAGVRHDMGIRTDQVAQDIVHCAKAGKFDVIEFGAKAGPLIGSVAQRVLATADLPVVLVK
jgi:nucleotide-binding universal stress UspA family protein